ncbi:MAG: alpha/beta hydrolase [Pseudorhodoplanes sp.]|nr:MAG: alpha/beta hydrolase [Pseudorhodoplanes sp.]
MTRHVSPQTTSFTGAAGNKLVADVFGDRGPPVILLHGGGQTRHAWRATAAAVARTGHIAYALDQRGHGDSEWVADGAYRFEDFATDVTAVAGRLAAESGHAPVAIGASLGGAAALIAEGKAARGGHSLLSALVLVDITPRVDGTGVDRIQAFMRAHAKEGFATIEDAARAVADYLPHRPRPRSTAGLKKNLRRSPDGRWRWHWDPRFMEGPRRVGGDRERTEAVLVEAARRLRVPTLLVRGGSSELVHEAHVKEFRALVPHAEYADVSGARHMVAGDQNDDFSAAVIDFLGRLDRKGVMQSAIFSQ